MVNLQPGDDSTSKDLDSASTGLNSETKSVYLFLFSFVSWVDASPYRFLTFTSFISSPP